MRTAPSCWRRPSVKLKAWRGRKADLIKSNLRVEYAPEQVQPGEIIRAIEGAGYAVPAEVSATTFVVEGMDCADEEKLIRKALGDLAGIEGMDFFLVSGTLRVKYKPALVDNEAIIRALSQDRVRSQGKKARTGGAVLAGQKANYSPGPVWAPGRSSGLAFRRRGSDTPWLTPIYAASYYHRRLLDGQKGSGGG